MGGGGVGSLLQNDDIIPDMPVQEMKLRRLPRHRPSCTPLKGAVPWSPSGR